MRVGPGRVGPLRWTALGIQLAAGSDKASAEEGGALDHPLMARLSDALLERVRRCREALKMAAVDAERR